MLSLVQLLLEFFWLIYDNAALNGYTFAGENHSIVVKFAESQPDIRSKFTPASSC